MVRTAPSTSTTPWGGALPKWSPPRPASPHPLSLRQAVPRHQGAQQPERVAGSLLGRFLSMDPLGYEAGDANLYRYVFNNPAPLLRRGLLAAGVGVPPHPCFDRLSISSEGNRWGTAKRVLCWLCGGGLGGETLEFDTWLSPLSG